MWPKVIGRNNSGFNTTINSIKYSEETDRTAISVFTNDPDKCQGVSSCNFIVMYTGEYLDYLWKKAYLNTNETMVLTFSQDGNQLAFFILEN